MLQRDYILRLVEQFSKRLGAILARKQAGDLDGAGASLGEAARHLVGLDVETLLAFPPRQLFELFRVGGVLDIAKCLVTADILREYADVAELRGQHNELLKARWLSLGLYLEVFGTADPEWIPKRGEYEKHTEALLDEFELSQLPASVGLHAIRFRELQGRFADAEDLLFLLIDGGQSELIASGIEFFQRLLSKRDAVLEQGGLSRGEVEEALVSLESRRASS